MKNTLINVLVFTVGAAAGSLVTWKVLKTRYERIAQEEIDSVKETWGRLGREESGTDDQSVCEEEEEDPDDSDDSDDPVVMKQYNTLARRYARSSGTDAENAEEGGGDEEVPYINGPQVITPDDFGNGNFEHDLYCLTYYVDGVLADDWYVKYDIEETIGEDSLEHFGDYTEDVLHVRNERTRADYEIVKDCRTYAEVMAAHPLTHMHGH